MSNIIIESTLTENISNEIIVIIKNCINETAVIEKCPYEFEISITITNNEEIRKINNEFRGIDKETDVLSFPLIDYKSPSDFSLINDEDDDLFNLDTKELILGDIVISFDKVKSQALDYGHSIEREVGFLTIHSMLHLFGYDHMTDEDETLMISKQKEILEKVGLKR